METWSLALGIRAFFRYVITLVLVVGSAGVGFTLGALAQLSQLMPSSEELASYRPQATTEIYSTEVQKDGSERHTLLARVFTENREPIDLREIPKNMVNAIIAIEDRRFWQHHGVSPRDMIRAAWMDIRKREIAQGASTITQQLVRNVWLSHERTWDRKLKEAMLALEVERKYSKEEILEMYLNEVCFGHGTFGIRTAARLYYGKEPKDLKLHECAMLAGLPRWPVGYSPYNFPERCTRRRNAVLDAMVREGMIKPQEARKAKDVPITEGLQPLQERGLAALRAPHFTNLVLRELCDQYGDAAIYQGGLRVFTTLDMRVQEIAERELTKGVERLRRSGAIRPGLVGQGALACVEVRTGRVLAMVGGVGPYEKVQYNRAHPGPPRYGRQPGSSFKPYIWAAALESGYSPNSVFSGDPISIRLGPSKWWSPKNYSPRQGGNYTLRRALADSVNLVSVRLVRKLTISRVRSVAARILGIPVERLRPVWAIALGTSELSPLEQAIGYCAFGNSGLRPTPRLVRRIENRDGQVLVDFPPELVRVIRPDTAASMLSMLITVVQSGTGTRARACGLPCGGKTGTTNSGRDVWFVGITPDLSVAVWVGNDDNSPMPRGTGGGFCAPIWAEFVRKASEALGCRGQFPEGVGVRSERRGEEDESEKREARTITVCAETGGRATDYCPLTKEIVLKPGQKAPGPCKKHRAPSDEPELTGGGQGSAVRVCPSSGMLASPYCPATRVRVFPPGEAPLTRCTVHGPNGGGGADVGVAPTERPAEPGVERRTASETSGGTSEKEDSGARKPTQREVAPEPSTPKDLPLGDLGPDQP